MSELWNYRHDVLVDDVDLVGFEVEATDGRIGTIDEASSDVGESYLVVDTGFWIFGHKRVIPARAVKQINKDDEVVFLDISKDEVKGAPDHHETWFEPEHREPFITYYEPFRW